MTPEELLKLAQEVQELKRVPFVNMEEDYPITFTDRSSGPLAQGYIESQEENVALSAKLQDAEKHLRNMNKLLEASDERQAAMRKKLQEVQAERDALRKVRPFADSVAMKVAIGLAKELEVALAQVAALTAPIVAQVAWELAKTILTIAEEEEQAQLAALQPKLDNLHALLKPTKA